MRTILEPETVAVIGASRDEDSIGGRLLRNLLTHPFKGTVYPVNPSAPAVQGVKAYATIEESPVPSTSRSSPSRRRSWQRSRKRAAGRVYVVSS